jgi:hypothetical protein
MADKIKELLKEANLSQYFNKFMDEGYSDFNGKFCCRIRRPDERHWNVQQVLPQEAVCSSCSNTCIKKWTWRTFEKFNASYHTTNQDDDVSKCKYLVTFEY